MSVTYEIATTFEPLSCGSCGVQFAMTETMYKKLRRNKKYFYCTNGCHIHFYTESDEERLRRQLDSEREENRGLSYRLDHANRSRAALRGQVTKIKRRVGNGVCPCCDRSFQDLKRHMEGQHPNWREE